MLSDCGSHHMRRTKLFWLRCIFRAAKSRSTGANLNRRVKSRRVRERPHHRINFHASSRNRLPSGVRVERRCSVLHQTKRQPRSPRRQRPGLNYLMLAVRLDRLNSNARKRQHILRGANRRGSRSAADTRIPSDLARFSRSALRPNPTFSAGFVRRVRRWVWKLCVSRVRRQGRYRRNAMEWPPAAPKLPAPTARKEPRRPKP